MTKFTLTCTSYFPHTGIAEVEGKRLAQIVAKLMAERFPAFAFSYAKSPALTAPNTNHFLDIGVKSLEVVRLMQEELASEADNNPEGLEKWLMFIFDDGQAPDNGPRFACYLEHDANVVQKCKADPTLAMIIPIYCDYPDWDDLTRRRNEWMAEQSTAQEPAGRFNCLTFDIDIETFAAFYIAPCRNDASQADNTNGETAVVQCGPDEAAFWTIYGSTISSDGCEWLAVHDAYSTTEIVRIARQINAETGKPFFYRDEDHGCIPQNGAKLDFQAIAEDLTHSIHDDLPDLLSDGFAKVDDFDAHPLAAMREAFVMFSDYAGRDTAADPYQPWEDRT